MHQTFPYVSDTNGYPINNQSVLLNQTGIQVYFGLYEFGKEDGIRRPIILDQSLEKYINVQFGEIFEDYR